MKHIHNIISNSFVTAALKEEEFNVKITKESSKRIHIEISKQNSNQRMLLNILHDSDGYIRSINVSQNTLLQTNEYPYSAFINAIYNEEYTYM